LEREIEKPSQYDAENLKLSIRQIKILSLILELEDTGPSKIANELGFSLSTSYRELISLENLKLLSLTESGKRKLTLKGKKYLEYYSNNF
jgi:Mn-dependent DtxR family transcriptional regulator